VRCVLYCGCPLSSAEGGAFRLGIAQPGAAGGGTTPPQRILRSCWAGEGLWAYQEGQIGKKMVRFGALRGTRSRQDESIEVGEVGSKRPSSGGNGVHVVSLYPLTWRSLGGYWYHGGAGTSQVVSKRRATKLHKNRPKERNRVIKIS
jgi:hypothetical protein